MDTSVKKIILSVVLTIILVLVSVPLWDYSSGRKGAILASSYNELNIGVEIGAFESLIVIEDERAFTYIMPTIVSLRNRNESSSKFDLLFLYDKRSTVPYEHLRVSIDNTIYNLNNIEKIEDNDNYYFILDNYSLDGYSEINLNARIWLNDDVGKLDETASLTTNFITREGV